MKNKIDIFLQDHPYFTIEKESNYSKICLKQDNKKYHAISFWYTKYPKSITQYSDDFWGIEIYWNKHSYSIMDFYQKDLEEFFINKNFFCYGLDRKEYIQHFKSAMNEMLEYFILDTTEEEREEERKRIRRNFLEKNIGRKDFSKIKYSDMDDISEYLGTEVSWKTFEKFIKFPCYLHGTVSDLLYFSKMKNIEIEYDILSQRIRISLFKEHSISFTQIENFYQFIIAISQIFPELKISFRDIELVEELYCAIFQSTGILQDHLFIEDYKTVRYGWLSHVSGYAEAENSFMKLYCFPANGYNYDEYVKKNITWKTKEKNISISSFIQEIGYNENSGIKEEVLSNKNLLEV